MLQAARACCGHCPMPNVMGKGMETRVVPSTLHSTQDELGESCGCFLALLSPLRAVSELFCMALMWFLFRSWQLQLSIPGRLQAEAYKDGEISPGSRGSCAQRIPPGYGGGCGHEAALRPPQTSPAAHAGSQQSRTQPAGHQHQLYAAAEALSLPQLSLSVEKEDSSQHQETREQPQDRPRCDPPRRTASCVPTEGAAGGHLHSAARNAKRCTWEGAGRMGRGLERASYLHTAPGHTGQREQAQ